MTTTEGITIREPHIVQAIRNIAGRKSTRGPTARMGPRLGAWALIGALSCVALTVTSTEAAVPAPDLQRFRGQSRVLLVFAPRDDDAALIRQRAIVGQARAAMDERDLVVIEVVGPGEEGAELRRRYNAAADQFRAVLIGKDGGAKLASADPLTARRLKDVIDAMPMRRNEAGASKPDRGR